MPAQPSTAEQRRERSRLTWSTWVAVALSLAVPSLVGGNEVHADLGHRLAGLTPLLIVVAGVLLRFHAPWRSVGSGLMRGGLMVLLVYLVLVPVAMVWLGS